MEIINVVEAKSRFSELFSRVATGERILFQRRERTIAALISASDFERLEPTVQAACRLAVALG